MSLGHRDPFTHRSASIGLVEKLALTNHVLAVERLVNRYQNVELHQYLYELVAGKDPRESEWFKRLT